jgi:hypothetical protein
LSVTNTVTVHRLLRPFLCRKLLPNLSDNRPPQMALGEVLAEAIGKLVQNNRPPQRALRATACQAFATYFCA